MKARVQWRTGVGALGLTLLAGSVGAHPSPSLVGQPLGADTPRLESQAAHSVLALADTNVALASADANSRSAARAQKNVTSSSPLLPAEGVGPKGLAGAALALTTRDFDRALALAESIDAPKRGTQAWYWQSALQGRAYRLKGEPERALAALRPLWKAKDERHFPPDVLGVELARAHLDYAQQPSLEVGDADAQRREAVAVLGKVSNLSPIRNLAEVRVLQAEAMLGIDGGKERASAARAAVQAADQILREYPNHPRIGELWLLRAEALERSGKTREAVSEYRAIVIGRAGEPEAERAQARLDAMAADGNTEAGRPLSVNEQLDRATAARHLRWVDLSREILDKLLDDVQTPSHLRPTALRSRSYTAYKQRDYAQCVADLKVLHQQSPTGETRDWLLRCLERGGFYDEAIAMLLEGSKNQKKKALAAHAVWEATELAVRAGQYARAESLLKQYETLGKGNAATRAWLHAWLPYRQGRHLEAAAKFEAVEAYRPEKTRARYFRGKLLLAHGTGQQRTLGAQLLRDVVASDALSYYGLMARQRLLEAGEAAPPVGTLEPLEDETLPPMREQTMALFDEVDAEFGSAWDSIRRARQLYASGYLEEAQRELRITAEVVANRGRKSTGLRDEGLYVGLAWKANWQYPHIVPSKAAKKMFRDGETMKKLETSLRHLARALEEPYRYAKFTSESEGEWRERWHPRAYRAAIEREARFRNIDPHHLWALMYTESRFRRHVVSPVGARGALQIMPWTGRQLAERLGDTDTEKFDADSLFLVDTNARLASYYVSELLFKFHDQPPMAYASYNGGPSNVARWLDAKTKGEEPTDLDTFIEEIPFQESYRYTKRVMEVHAAYSLLYRKELPQWRNDVDPVYESNIDF